MNTIAAVFQKELKDGIRDRRAVMSAFIFPLLAPIMVYGFVHLEHQAEIEAVIADLPGLVDGVREQLGDGFESSHEPP